MITNKIICNEYLNTNLNYSYFLLGYIGLYFISSYHYSVPHLLFFYPYNCNT